MVVDGQAGAAVVDRLHGPARGYRDLRPERAGACYLGVAQSPDQERAGAHPGRLELVLLALSSGAVLAPPLAAFVEHHLGAIRTVRWAAPLATAVCGLLAGAARMARA